MNNPGDRLFTLLLISAIFLAGCTGFSDAEPKDGISIEKGLPTRAMPAPTVPLTNSLPTPLMRETPASVKVSATPQPAVTAPPVVPTPTGTPADGKSLCENHGQIVTGSFQSTVVGSTQTFRIYLPPCYGSDPFVYPAIYLFHGSVQDSSHWDQLGIDETAEQLTSAGQIPPVAIVMPDGGVVANNTSGGPGSFEDLVVYDLISHVEQEYCLWRDRIGRAIGGISRGGYWALEIAFRHPDLFGRVGGHSVALLDVAAGPEINPQYTGLNNPLGDLQIYLDIGANDYVLNNIRTLHEEMSAAGIPHTWLLNEGAHTDEYWASHTGDYLMWYTGEWPVTRSAYPGCERALMSDQGAG